jgi:hypothetical protein
MKMQGRTHQFRIFAQIFNILHGFLGLPKLQKSMDDLRMVDKIMTLNPQEAG